MLEQADATAIAAEFLDARFQEREGRAVVVLRGPSGELTSRRWFGWPEQRPKMLEYIERHRHEDVYTSDALFKVDRAAKQTVKSLTSVQCDADAFDVSKFRLEPSEIVTTSEGRTHAHWDIIGTEDPDVIEPLAHSVSVAHPKAEDGVDFGWSRAKLIRIPGTTNTKYTPHQTVTSAKTGAVYTVEEFAAAYPPVAPVAVAEYALRDLGKLPTRVEALKSLRASVKLMELLDKTHTMGMDPSKGRFLLENELFRCGASDEAVFVLLSDHPFRSKKDDNNLWQDILRARAKFEQAPAEAEEDAPEDGQIETTVEPPELPKELDFLTQEEKDGLPQTFVSEYVSWASQKTDANPEYHTAAAFTLLSTVFGDHGNAPVPFSTRGLPLNLWFMILGPTTVSRKTTALHLLLDMLDELQDEDGQYKYSLGADFTGEGLTNVLLDRENRSALVHKDEFHGLLAEMEQKAYQSGLKETLTALYDGRVSGKLRSTGEAKMKKPVRAAFVLWAMGTTRNVSEAMNVEDFQSGFLARFLYVVGHAPKSTKGLYTLRQPSADEVTTGDSVMLDMIDRLKRARGHWDGFHQPGAPTHPVPCTVEAWDRLNAFIEDVMEAAEGQERHEIIKAASDRMTKNILKAATLLAMFDCADEVQIWHMRAAISYGAKWFEHMVFMANAITASGFRRRQKDVLRYVEEQGGEVTRQALSRKFRDWPRGELSNVLQFLTDDTGWLHLGEGNKKFILTDEGNKEARAA
jgi:hypothetical protein